MTDKELADLADAAFRATTISYPDWQRRVQQGKYPDVTKTKWWQGFDALGKIGATPPTPPPPPPPPPPPSGWPASYTTGPLGTANVLPSAPGKQLLVEYPGGPGKTWADAQAQVASRESAIGRKFDAVQTQLWWAKGSLLPAEKNEQRLEWIHGRGQVPCVSAYVPYSIAETNAAAADATWKATADYFHSLGFPLMMRLWWEFNNDAGFPWSSGHSSSIGVPFVTAWQRVVNIFKAQGATNVGFWWCPTEGGDRAGTELSYPGDAFVDWAGSDVYSHCYASETSCYEGFAGPGWASFAQLALYTGQPARSAYELYSGVKPFVWGEVGCVLDPSRPDLKAAWFPALATSLKSSRACGISFFDQDISSLEGPRSNWLVDYGAGAMAGFTQMAQQLA